MSVHPPTCPDCRREGTIDRAGPFPGKGEESTYAVAWRCPQCGKKSLDVCPLGPLVPSTSLCLNCGTAYPGENDDCSCLSCGLPRNAVLAALGVEVVPDDPLAAAHDAFRRGLIRRGLAILNRALQDDAGLADAWSLKCSFLDSLGYLHAKSTMLEGALAAKGPAALWISYGFTLQELDRHADAVAAYGRYLEALPAGPWAAVAHGNRANSLARLGELPAAEEAYRRALALEPQRISHASNYIRFLIDNRRLPEALTAIDAGLEKATENADLIALLEDRTAILAEQQNATEALESIEAALALGSDSVRTHYLRGRVLGLLSRLEEAREAILRVLALDPENADGKEALQTIDSVLIWGRLRRPEDLG
jgi:tetratricopeptide (TPR) repeat protein